MNLDDLKAALASLRGPDGVWCVCNHTPEQARALATVLNAVPELLRDLEDWREEAEHTEAALVVAWRRARKAQRKLIELLGHEETCRLLYEEDP